MGYTYNARNKIFSIDERIKVQMELEKNHYYYHHTSLTRGYIPKKYAAIVEPYKGRFGEGYILHWPNSGSNQYHEISYYIWKG